jgi:hypothetical protein
MDLYVISYRAGGRGCPEFVGGTLAPFPAWKPFVVGSAASVTDAGFTFQRKHRLLACDYFTYGAHYIVSHRWKALGETHGVPGAYAPLRSEFAGGTVDEDSYFLFCPGDHRSVLDVSTSAYDVQVSGDTGLPQYNNDFPDVPVVHRIESFVIDPAAAALATIFYCVDIEALVCSGPIAAAIRTAGLRAIALTPLDADYRFHKYPVLDRE